MYKQTTPIELHNWLASFSIFQEMFKEKLDEETELDDKLKELTLETN